MVPVSPLSRRRAVGLVAGLLLAACGAGTGDSSGTANFVVRMRDKPIEAADHVFVTIERVDIYRVVDSGGEEMDDGEEVVRETVTSTPGRYDLLELQHGVEAVLGGGSFPAGRYKSIRLVVARDGDDDIAGLPAVQLKNYIVVEGEAYPLRVPSGAQTGIKLGKNFEIPEEGTTVLTIDFDVRKSVTRCGTKHVYLLKPCLQIVPNVEDDDGGGGTGTFSGMVTTLDGTGLPAGTVVSVQQSGVEVASAQPDPMTGDYAVPGLADGSYDIVVIAPGYTFDAEVGATVAGGVGGTHSFEIVTSDIGTIFGVVTAGGGTADTSVTLSWGVFTVGSMNADPSTGEYLFTDLPAGDYVVTAANATDSTSQATSLAGGTANQVDLALP